MVKVLGHFNILVPTILPGFINVALRPFNLASICQHLLRKGEWDFTARIKIHSFSLLLALQSVRLINTLSNVRQMYVYNKRYLATKTACCARVAPCIQTSS